MSNCQISIFCFFIFKYNIIYLFLFICVYNCFIYIFYCLIKAFCYDFCVFINAFCVFFAFIKAMKISEVKFNLFISIIHLSDVPFTMYIILQLNISPYKPQKRLSILPLTSLSLLLSIVIHFSME